MGYRALMKVEDRANCIVYLDEIDRFDGYRALRKTDKTDRIHPRVLKSDRFRKTGT